LATPKAISTISSEWPAGGTAPAPGGSTQQLPAFNIGRAVP
jgi:hypothetical protein